VDGDEGIDYAILAMPHRGRLTTLVVLNDFPVRNLLHKVAGNCEIPDEIEDRIDDMPTHIAVSNTKKFGLDAGVSKNQKKVTLSMIHNPSHLESHNAISMGKTRAKMDDFGKKGKKTVLNI
jgi:probable 2-oxoglutarate dehydrogenase E1 component DHKTD1